LIEWGEIKSYVWKRSADGQTATLVLTLDDESQRLVTIKELGGALERQLKERLLLTPRDTSYQSTGSASR
jgi:hypothetical protein